MCDKTKVQKILSILEKNPNGLWIRELARQANLDKSTVSIYIKRHLNLQVREEWVGRNKLIRLNNGLQSEKIVKLR